MQTLLELLQLDYCTSFSEIEVWSNTWQANQKPKSDRLESRMIKHADQKA